MLIHSFTQVLFLCNSNIPIDVSGNTLGSNYQISSQQKSTPVKTDKLAKLTFV